MLFVSISRTWPFGSVTPIKAIIGWSIVEENSNLTPPSQRMWTSSELIRVRKKKNKKKLYCETVVVYVTITTLPYLFCQLTVLSSSVFGRSILYTYEFVPTPNIGTISHNVRVRLWYVGCTVFTTDRPMCQNEYPYGYTETTVTLVLMFCGFCERINIIQFSWSLAIASWRIS